MTDGKTKRNTRRFGWPSFVMTFLNLGMLMLPAMMVGMSLMQPESLMLRLGAVAMVLMMGEVLLQSLSGSILSSGEADGFTFHFGTFFVVFVVGMVLAVWWGWRSTGIVLAADAVWQVVGSLRDRRAFERLSSGEE